MTLCFYYPAPDVIDTCWNPTKRNLHGHTVRHWQIHTLTQIYTQSAGDLVNYTQMHPSFKLTWIRLSLNDYMFLCIFNYYILSWRWYNKAHIHSVSIIQTVCLSDETLNQLLSCLSEGYSRTCFHLQTVSNTGCEQHWLHFSLLLRTYMPNVKQVTGRGKMQNANLMNIIIRGYITSVSTLQMCFLHYRQSVFNKTFGYGCTPVLWPPSAQWKTKNMTVPHAH